MHVIAKGLFRYLASVWARPAFEQQILPQKWAYKNFCVQVSFSEQTTFSKKNDLLITCNTTTLQRKNDFKRFISTKTALMKKCQKKYKTFLCSWTHKSFMVFSWTHKSFMIFSWTRESFFFSKMEAKRCWK